MNTAAAPETVVSLPPEPGTHVTVRGLCKSFAGAPLYTNFNLDLPRAGSPGSGLASPRVLNLVPPPPERKSPLAEGIEKSAKPDCRKAYSGMGPLAVGTDGAGSVRIPAAFCGNVGLKPSFGRVPAYPLSPFGTVAHLGPHTMSVRDAALMMNVLKQPDARDWHALPPDGDDYLQHLERGIRGLKIAYSPALGYAQDIHPEVAAAVQAAVRQLQDLGAHVEQLDPGIEDPLPISIGLWFAGAWAIWNALTPAQQALADPDFATEAEAGSKYGVLELHRLTLARGALGAHMRQFMQRVDLLVTPAVAVPAFDARPAGSVPLTPQNMLGWTPFSYPFNLTQQPACTIPCGLTRDGLPIGLQIVGPMFGDALVLRAARAYETLRPIPRPALDF